MTTYEVQVVNTDEIYIIEADCCEDAVSEVIDDFEGPTFAEITDAEDPFESQGETAKYKYLARPVVGVRVIETGEQLYVSKDDVYVETTFPYIILDGEEKLVSLQSDEEENPIIPIGFC